MTYKKAGINISALIIMLVMIISMGIFGVSASSDFIIENGILISYNGNDKKVSIPSEVYYIADYAFKGNKTIESVELNNVSVVGNCAFLDCASLVTVKEYDNLSSCGAYAFYGTAFFTQHSEQDLILGAVLVHSKAEGEYTVPSDIKSVAPYAFSDNNKITSVVIGDNVMSVGESAFRDCSKLSSVSVSSNVTHVGGYAFEGTEYLNTSAQEFLVLGNGILVHVNKEEENIVIPSNVKQIGDSVFAGNNIVKSVTIPEGVSSIGKRAFAMCRALENADLPASILSVGTEAFYDCTSLKNVIIPESVKILGDSVYLGCTSLKTARVYTSAPLSAGLFAGCTKLESVLIAMTPEHIMSYAFYGCVRLREMSLPASVTFVAENAFENCNKLTVFCYADENVGKILTELGVNVSEVGDANSDGKLNVRDSTHIRKSIAGLINLDFTEELKADTDFNGLINVRDATRIQKKLVGVI